MLDAAVVVYAIDIRQESVSQRIYHFDIAVLIGKNGLCCQAFVLYLLFLQGSQAHDGAGKYRPKLSPHESFLLECSCGDFVGEGLAGVFPERVDLVEVGAEVIFSAFLHAYLLR